MRWTVWLVSAPLLIAGCASVPSPPRLEPIETSPFAIRLVKTAGWREGLTGYDVNLPGYHLVGDIASVRIKGQGDRLPRKLVLAIRTSPGMAPRLESFTMTAPGAFVQSGMGAGLQEQVMKIVNGRPAGRYEAAPGGTYFTFQVVGDEVRVTFQPSAMELLKQECTVSWVDYWR